MLHLLYRLYGRTVVILLALLVNLHSLLKIFYHILGGRGSVYHGALALPTANRHRQIISVILVLMLLWILVVFIIYSPLIGWSGFGVTRT